VGAAKSLNLFEITRLREGGEALKISGRNPKELFPVIQGECSKRNRERGRTQEAAILRGEGEEPILLGKEGSPSDVYASGRFEKSVPNGGGSAKP